MKVRWIGVLALCLAVATAYGEGAKEGGAAAQGPVTLRFSWWGGDARHKATLAALDIYQKKNPTVKIEAEYSGFDGYYQKLVTQLASGTAPDVFQSDQGWTAEFYKRGDVFLPLEKYSSLLDLSVFTEQLLNDYCRMAGHTIVVPLGYNGTVLLYNKTMLAKYGITSAPQWTWDQMIEVGKRVHADNPNQYLFTNITDGYVRFILRPYLKQLTGKVTVKDDYSVGFTEQQIADTFSFMLQLFESGTAEPYDKAVLYKDAVSLNPSWTGGNIGATLVFLSTIARDTANLPFEVGVTRLPALASAPASGQESGPSLMMAAFTKTKRPEAAVKFINYFVSDPDCIRALGTERSVPASQKAVTILSQAGKIDALMASSAAVSSATAGFPNGALEMNPSVHALFVQYMEQVIYKQLTPQAAATALVTALKQRLGEMKK
jgi:oligogalacturonide transport system substrate-binding protein